jgi:hypothetical protein
VVESELLRLLMDIEEIKQLKARYCRLLDTKQWDLFRDVFTPDLRFWRDPSIVPDPTGRSEPDFWDRESYVAYVRQAQASSMTVHRCYGPEIQVLDPDDARGTWAMADRIDNAAEGRAFVADGHYHETYHRGPDDRWRIRTMRLTRLRVEPATPRDPADLLAGRLDWFATAPRPIA